MRHLELGAFAEVFNGKTPSKAEQRSSGLPILKIRDMDEFGEFRGNYGSFVEQSFYDKYSKKLLETGDTIVLNAAHNSNYVGNKNAQISSDVAGVIATGEWLIIRPKSVFSGYVNHFIKSHEGKRRLKSRVKGIHLYPKDVARIKIPVPEEYDDQIRIAHLLGKVEGLIAQRKQSLQQLDELLKSVFLEMFSIQDGSYKEWPIDKLVSHAEVVSGVTKGKKYKAEELIEVPYMRVANVQDAYFSLDEIKTISVTQKEFNRYLLKSGDLLLTEGGDPDKLGRGSVWEEQIEGCIHQNHIFRVRINNVTEVNPYYLSGLVGSIYGKAYFLKSAKQTTGIASINSTQLKNFPTIIPPVDLQNKFTAIVEKVGNIKPQYQESLTELETLYGVLSQRAFKGELDLSRVVTDEVVDSDEKVAA